MLWIKVGLPRNSMNTLFLLNKIIINWITNCKGFVIQFYYVFNKKGEVRFDMNGTTNAITPHSNKNLLDNWDFTNPVNQRGGGVTSNYTVTSDDFAKGGRKFTIDRWQLSNNSMNNYVKIDNEGISLRLVGLYASLSQIIPIYNVYNAGREVTLSCLALPTSNTTLRLSLEFYNIEGNDIYVYSNVTLSNPVKSFNINGSTYNLYQTSITMTNNEGYLYCHIINTEDDNLGRTASILAMKLEYGSESTLPYDILGVSYGEELRKCQRYYQRLVSKKTHTTISTGTMYSGIDIFFTINLPVPMRTFPAISVNGTAFIQDITNESNAEFDNISLANIVSELENGTILKLHGVTKTVVTRNDNCLINLGNGSYIELSADL